MSRDPSLLSFPTIQLYGDVRHHVFANLSLLDGHWYKVKVVGCNGAGLCSHTETDEQLVDNSPPTPGSFAVLTDHAINLERHRGGYMVYNLDVISVAFLGFADPHSDIQNYHVAVGTFYDGADLVGGSTVRVYHYGQDSHRDEGTIERVNITITREVQPGEIIYITIWAENKVGLTSRRLHGSFVAVVSSLGKGTLELNRRCSSWSCQGHCTCSPQDQTCQDTSECANVTDVPGYQTVIIKDVDVSTAATSDDKDYTHVTCLMAAEWHPTGTGLSPVRYDWSVGERGAAPGTGLMDRATDVIWRDNGHLTSAVFTVSKDPYKGLLPGKSYAFHVRAWYDENHYSTYSSDGIIADNQGLQVSKSVVPREIRRIGSLKDIDITADLSSVNITWKHVFLPGSIPLHHVTVSIGTKYGGDDVTKTEYSGSVLEAMVTGLDLREGVKYYTTVEVVNMGGLHVSSHSDGFVVDLTKPDATSATVSDGAGLHDVRYQRDNISVSASWHGFVDHQSPLAGYVWCVRRDDGTNIVPCTHVGLALSGYRSLPSGRRLIHGRRYVSRVQAVDAGGHVSDFVYSDGFTVDNTAPEEAGHTIGANLLVDGSFETATLSQIWLISAGSAQPWRSSAKTGQQSMLVKGTVSQVVRNCACDIVKVTFWTSPFMNISELDHGSGAIVGINTEMHLFTVHDNDVGWQKHCYYSALGGSNDVTLTFSAGSSSVFLLDSVSLHAVSRTTSSTSEIMTVDVLPGSEPGTCYVAATWSLVDPESEIKEFKWAIGTVKGGVQLQPFKSVSTMNHAKSSKLTLSQGTSVHVTVKTTNGAGLIGVFHSEPVRVDYTPPKIVGATINNQPANGTSYVSDIIHIMWEVNDQETPVKGCEYSIGHTSGMSDFLPLTPALNNRGAANLTSLTHGDELYVNIRCTNNKDMTGYFTTEPVVIVTGPPDSSGARLTPIMESTSVYPTRGHHQSQTTQIRLSWTGFSDVSGISHYELKTSEEGRVVSDWKTVAAHPVQFSDLTNLDLRAYKTYTLVVRAVNYAGYMSQGVTATMTVEVTEPYVTGASLNIFWNPQHTIHLDWAGMYVSNSSLVYDVSVGTYEGGCDVLCAVETTDHKMVVTSVDSSVQHHVVITAVNQAGLWRSSSHVIGHPGNT